MAKRGIAIFELKSDNPQKIRQQLLDEFPSFFRRCQKDKTLHHFKFSQLGAARFERDYDMSINEFAVHSFYALEEKDNTKYKRRTLGVS